MHITYLLDGSANSLYDGKHGMNGRFHTYGQQTYILDLITGLARRGHAVRVVARGAEKLPVLATLERLANVSVATDWGGGTDLLLVDEAPDDLVAAFDPELPALKIVHDALSVASPYLVERCLRFVCMTENAVRNQEQRLPPGKTVLLRQGIDLQRFHPFAERSTPARPRVLMCCRLDSGREDVLTALVANLDRRALAIRVVGDGPGFWELERRFGDEILLMNHVPNRSMPHLLRETDVVISLGRGAMEAMATGLPVLCAGYGYAGPITPANLPALLERNLTAFGYHRDPALVMADVRAALATPPAVMRTLAERYFSVDAAVEQLTSLVRTKPVLAPG
ncbi:MAG: hypothetical protein QOH97_1816 [Actinoplanes sp.]|jgi:glycosyltransferase involved in cell wall biosynthesis|nr:hypothetical protein [Actinoplanes sp.]